MSKLLLIDDEKAIVRVLSISLKSDGYDVVTAYSGEEGLEVFQRESPDIVLTDIKMPGMDGLEVTERIKARCPWTPVVVITGYPCIDTAKQAVRLGAFNYLTKPLGPDEVMKAANDAMTQKRWALRSDRDDQQNKTEFTTH